MWSKVSASDERLVIEILSAEEFPLWSAMQRADRAHSLKVLRRLMEQRPTTSRAEKCAALLHDVGKSVSKLSTMGRVMATLLGGCTPRMRLYRSHEAIGARMLEGVSEDLTILLQRLDVPTTSDCRQRPTFKFSEVARLPREHGQVFVQPLHGHDHFPY